MPDRRDPPFSPQQIRADIAPIPRVELAYLPTPLDECPRLSAALGGPRILVKRDDLTGLAFGGNKVRNSEFRLAEAKRMDADYFLAALEIESNSARQTAAACNRLGMKVIYATRAPKDYDWRGNSLVVKVLGADVRLFPPLKEKVWLGGDTGLMDELQTIAADLRAKGHRPYVMREGEMYAMGPTIAYILCTAEIHEQLAALGTHADYIYVTSGGKTQAGLILGGKALGDSFKVIGETYFARPNVGPFTAGLVNKTADYLGWNIAITPDEVITYQDHAGKEYGPHPEKTVEAIKLAARTEGLILGPMYVGKTMAAMIDHIREGRIGRNETVVFIHTGGTPEIFAFKDRLLENS